MSGSRRDNGQKSQEEDATKDWTMQDIQDGAQPLAGWRITTLVRAFEESHASQQEDANPCFRLLAAPLRRCGMQAFCYRRMNFTGETARPFSDVTSKRIYTTVRVT